MPESDYGIYYVSLHHSIDCKIKGQKAKGFTAFDQTYMVEDAILYLNKDWVIENKGYLFWYCVECATKMVLSNVVFLCFYMNAWFAIIIGGKEVIETQNIEGHLIYSEDNTSFSDRIEITVNRTHGLNGGTKPQHGTTRESKSPTRRYLIYCITIV